MSKTTEKQEDKWERLFTLLRTTNFEDDIENRKFIARKGSLAELKNSHLDWYKLDHTWETRRMSLDKLIRILIPECTVGHKGTTLQQVMKAVAGVLEEHKLDEGCWCSLRHNKTECMLHVLSIRRQQEAVCLDLAKQDAIKESDALIEAAGPDAFMVRWFVPLTREE